MGFLNYWREREPEEVQGELLKPESEAKPVVNRGEPTRLSSYHRLHDEVKQRGGDKQTHQAINYLQNQELLGVDYQALYNELGITVGDRDKLPKEAKEALMVGDIAAFHQIMTDDAHGHQAVLESSHRGFKRARQLFPW